MSNTRSGCSAIAVLRVLVVAPQPFYSERGTPIAIRLLVQSLCDDGHQVDVLTYHIGTDISYPGLTMYRSPAMPGIRDVPIGISVKKLVCDMGLAVRLAQRLWSGQYDIVHAVEEAIFPAVLLNLFSKRRLVYDMDSLLSEQLVDKWQVLRPLASILAVLERAAMKRCDCVLAVCEDLAEKVRPHVRHDRVRVLPDIPMPVGTDVTGVEVLRRHLQDDEVLLLYVGNLEHYQGLRLLLEAVAKLTAGTHYKLIVIGGHGQHIDEHRKRAHELGVGDKVLFLGPRPVSALSQYLSQADVLVSPRVQGRNTPMKIYSYMQAGKAILATRIRSHTQVLDDGCCMLAEPTPTALARCLETLLGDAGLREHLGAAALRRVESEFSLAAFRDQLRRTYAVLASARA
jgi:glycosyltransferase involved in cell wall biosynthesis